MALGGRLVIGRPLRKGEAVGRAGIELDLGGRIAGLKRLRQGADGLQRRPAIGFSAGEIELGLGLVGDLMGAVLAVGDQIGAI